MAPTSGKPFLLYVKVIDHSLSSLLAQKDDDGHEHAIYYLSRTLIGAESRYNPIEKECLALVFAIQKTRHYFCLLYTSPSPRDRQKSRMPSSA